MTEQINSDKYFRNKMVFYFLISSSVILALWMFLIQNYPMCLACISLGVATYSVILGFGAKELGENSVIISNKSKEIAEDSDKKVNAIANANFQRVIGQIEDLRLELKSTELTKNSKGKFELIPKLFTKREIYSWKCVTYVRETNTILKECDIITPFYIKRYLNLFNKYIEQIKVVKKLLSCEEVHHLFIIFKRMFDIKLEKFLDEKTLDDVEYESKMKKGISYLREILVENKKTKIDKNFIENYDIAINNFFRENEENKRLIFYDVKDKIKMRKK